MPTQAPLEAFLTTLPEWSSDARCSSLFAPQPDRATNPTGYDDRVRFWKDIVLQACGRGLLGECLLCVDLGTLEEKFKRKGAVPNLNAGVLAELIRSGDLVPLNSFAQSVSWTWWTFSTFVKRPVSWGLSQIMPAPGTPAKPQGLYVVVPLVRETSDRLLTTIRQSAHYKTDYIMSKETLHDQYASKIAPSGSIIPLSQMDLDILLRYLKQRLDVVVSEDANAQDGSVTVLKFKSGKEPQSQKLTISEVDRGILTIKTTVHRLTTQIEQMELKITNLTSQAQERIRAKQKSRALYCIRQKKSIEGVLKKRLASLETIEAILHKIQGAETDAEIFAAYNVGATTLQSVLTNTGLTVSVVEETMEKLQDVMADQAEVDEAIRAGNETINAASGVDDDELEQELDELLRQEVEGLPSVAGLPLPDGSVEEGEKVDQIQTKTQTQSDGTRPLSSSSVGVSGAGQQDSSAGASALDAELDALESELADQLGSLKLSQAEPGGVNSLRREQGREREKESREAVLA